MKFYPCIVMAENELQSIGVRDARFENGRIRDRSVISAIEDHCGRPVVSVRKPEGDTGEILVLAADGYIQYNRLNDKRTVVLFGQLDSLKTVLSDIFAERPDEDPYDVFCSYSYQTGITIQLDLDEWVRNEYKKS